MLEAIETRNQSGYQLKVQGYIQTAPFDKVRSQLFVKIKESYMPEVYSQGVSNMASLDFTGADHKT